MPSGGYGPSQHTSNYALIALSHSSRAEEGTQILEQIRVMTTKNWPIVCVSASSGELEIYACLLRDLTAQCGLTIVVVNHRRYQLAKLLNILEKSTPMRVQVVTQGMIIEQNHLYVIQPTSEVTMCGDFFHLRSLRRFCGWPRIIAVFSRSLVDAWPGLQIAVVLSGTDFQGAETLVKVKAAGGITFLKKPEPARYRDMPNNARDRSFADFELSPKEIAQELIQQAQHAIQGESPFLTLKRGSRWRRKRLANQPCTERQGLHQ